MRTPSSITRRSLWARYRSYFLQVPHRPQIKQVIKSLWIIAWHHHHNNSHNFKAHRVYKEVDPWIYRCKVIQINNPSMWCRWLMRTKSRARNTSSTSVSSIRRQRLHKELVGVTDLEVEPMEAVMALEDRDKSSQFTNCQRIMYASDATSRDIILRTARPIKTQPLTPTKEREYRRNICGKETWESVHRNFLKTNRKTSGR